MQVMIGDSRERPGNRWEKAEVTLDETDLRRLLLEYGLDPDLNYRASDVFLLLDFEANLLVLKDLLLKEAVAKEAYESQVGQLSSFRDQVVARMRG